MTESIIIISPQQVMTSPMGSVITVYRGILTLVTGLIITILTYIKMSHFQI